MNVDVILTPLEADENRIEGRSVVVIDVFRATSCMCAALENGAKSIMPLASVKESCKRAEELNQMGEKVLLGGERKMMKIEGFDLDNSPKSYKKEVVEGKKIVMSTTNGTRSVELSIEGKGKNILIGSMLNAKAVVEKLVELKNDIVLFCSGRADRFSVEDTFCAGYIAHLLEEKGVKLMDISKVVCQMFKHYDTNVEQLMKYNTHYQKLIEIDLKEDAKYCLQRDIFKSVPEVIAGEIVVR